MKNIFLPLCLLVLLAVPCFSETVLRDSVKAPDGRVIVFDYVMNAIEADSIWPLPTVGLMKENLGESADWYILTYSGGNIALMRDTKTKNENYQLVTSSVGRVPYDLFYLISLRLIELHAKRGESIIISDSKSSLNKMAKKLRTMRRNKELAKFFIN